MIDERVKRLRISIVGCGHICIDNGYPTSYVVHWFGKDSVCCLCKKDGPWPDCISHNNVNGTNQAKADYAKT